jgi:hypothetical protein
MVAWIGVHTYMALGYFWVQESHRRKGKPQPLAANAAFPDLSLSVCVCVYRVWRGTGLGKILAVDQTLKTFDYVRPYMAPEQVSAYMFTEADNHASRTLFESLGFEVPRTLPTLAVAVGSSALARSHHQPMGRMDPLCLRSCTAKSCGLHSSIPEPKCHRMRRRSSSLSLHPRRWPR